MTETGATARAAERPHGRRPGSASLRLTLLFMIVLLALGTVGLASLSLLRFATRPPSQDGSARRICTAYLTRNYDLLVAQIDPSPIPPAVTGPFTDASKRALIGELQALDASAGPVTHCQGSRLTFDSVPTTSTHAQYAFTMTRSGDPSKQLTLVMTLVHQPDGTWKIARNSNFIGTTP